MYGFYIMKWGILLEKTDPHFIITYSEKSNIKMSVPNLENLRVILNILLSFFSFITNQILLTSLS